MRVKIFLNLKRRFSYLFGCCKTFPLFSKILSLLGKALPSDSQSCDIDLNENTGLHASCSVAKLLVGVCAKEVKPCALAPFLLCAFSCLGRLYHLEPHSKNSGLARGASVCGG